MFFVFNKEKIYAYLVSVVTVCLLFFIASSTSEKAVQTSSNSSQNTIQNCSNEIKENNIIE